MMRDDQRKPQGESVNHQIVSMNALSEAALAGVVEEFVSREGTDYGHRDHSWRAKKDAVIRQLERGEAVIVFDHDTQTVNIVRVDALDRAGL